MPVVDDGRPTYVDRKLSDATDISPIVHVQMQISVFHRTPTPLPRNPQEHRKAKAQRRQTTLRKLLECR